MTHGSEDPAVGSWLPSPFVRVQHRMVRFGQDWPYLRTRCGEIVVDYPTDDPRVPWTSWQRCPDCQNLARPGT